MVRGASDWSVGPASGWGEAGLASRVPGQQLYSTAEGLYQDGVWWLVHKRTPDTAAPEDNCEEVDIYSAMSLAEKKTPLDKLVLVTRVEAPAMIGWYNRFIAPCKGHAGPPKFLHYHCIHHQQATCAKVISFGHVMTEGCIQHRLQPKQHRL